MGLNQRPQLSNGDKVFAGLIAEEVHDAGLSEFVVYDEESRPNALAYSNMVPLLVKAVQDLTAEIDRLKGAAEITALAGATMIWEFLALVQATA